MKLISALLILVASGCAITPKMDYSYSLKEPGKIASTDGIVVDAKVGVLHIDLTITNNGTSTLQLNLNESLFVAMDGRTIRLIEGGTTLMARSGMQPPIVIPKGVTVTKKLLSSNIDTSMGVAMPEVLLPDSNKSGKYTGKEFSLLLSFYRAEKKLEVERVFVVQ